MASGDRLKPLHSPAGIGAIPGGLPGLSGLAPDASEAMAAKAQQLWQMLDDLAESNPEAYAKLIKRQIEEGKDHVKQRLEPPKPGFCVRTLSYDGMPVYINVSQCARVNKPKDDNEPLPVLGLPVRRGVEIAGKSSAIIDIVFHPSIIERCNTDVPFRLGLIDLAIDSAEDLSKDTPPPLRLVRNGADAGDPYVGDAAHLYSFFDKGKKGAKPASEVRRGDGDASEGHGSSLFAQLGSIAQSMDPPMASGGSGSPNAADKIAVLPSEIVETTKKSGPSKPLIQEVSADTVASSPTTLDPLPEYSVEWGDGHAIVRFALPLIDSVAEVELEMAGDSAIELTVPGKYASVLVDLGRQMDGDNYKAKFIKSKRSLVVTIPFEAA